jgi:hypothetical protein
MVLLHPSCKSLSFIYTYTNFLNILWIQIIVKVANCWITKFKAALHFVDGGSITYKIEMFYLSNHKSNWWYVFAVNFVLMRVLKLGPCMYVWRILHAEIDKVVGIYVPKLPCGNWLQKRLATYKLLASNKRSKFLSEHIK